MKKLKKFFYSALTFSILLNFNIPANSTQREVKVYSGRHYNTDRGVFKIINGKITLIEIARGVRLKEDIINQISFKIKVSTNLKKISKSIYFDKKIGLKKSLI